MCTRALAGALLALSLTLSTSPGFAAPPAKAKANNQTGHGHHLLKAEEDLVAAEAAIVSQNLSLAQKDVASALKEIQEAIAHHHKNNNTTNSASGLTGVIQKAKHHTHGTTLKQAEMELLAAEKALQAGNGTQASKEITQAAKTVKNAVASHNHLPGKQ